MSSASALTSSLAGAPAQTLQAARARRSAETASSAAIQRVGDLIEIHLRSVEEGTDENSAAQLRIDPRSKGQQQSRSSNNSRQRSPNSQPQQQHNSSQQQPAAPTAPDATPAGGQASPIATGTGPGTEDHPAALYKHLDIRA